MPKRLVFQVYRSKRPGALRLGLALVLAMIAAMPILAPTLPVAIAQDASEIATTEPVSDTDDAASGEATSAPSADAGSSVDATTAAAASDTPAETVVEETVLVETAEAIEPTPTMTLVVGAPDPSLAAPAVAQGTAFDVAGGLAPEATATAPEGAPSVSVDDVIATVAAAPATEMALADPGSVDLPDGQQKLVAALEIAAPDATVAVVVASDAAVSPVSAAAALNVAAVPAATAAAILVGTGVTFSNPQFSGNPSQLGSFTGGTGIIGFDSGIILSTGNVADVVGPNDTSSKTTVFGGPGDPGLDTLVSPSTTHDAAILTLDFVPQGNMVVFQYVFSSEEYLEFVNAGYSDVFAFYVNGQNCATLNGDNITVDDINPGSNAGQFVDNTDGHLDTQMDGLTVVLTCTATVNAGQTNTLRLAIADTGDGRLDSAVFIQSKSFVVPSPTVPVTETPVVTITPTVPASPEVTATSTPTNPASPEVTATSTPTSPAGTATAAPTECASPTAIAKVEQNARVDKPLQVTSLPRTGQGAEGKTDAMLPILLLAAAGSAALAVGVGVTRRGTRERGSGERSR